MVKGRLSVVIPSRNEKFLQKTIDDILVKAKGDVEVIAVLDGYWPEIDEIVEDDKVRYLHHTKAKGMRASIKDGVNASTGEFIGKCDGHVMFGEGFDEILKADSEDDLVQIPTRLRLEPEKWELRDVEKPPMNYLYLAYPTDPGVWGGASLQGREWTDKNKDESLKEKLIDDAMTSQGSFWFMQKNYFDWLEIPEEEKYGTFTKEMQEIGLKVWLSGGTMIRNKKTWYAHLHKGKKYGRGYPSGNLELEKGAKYTNRWIYEIMWHKQIHAFNWLIDKFWPLPTWPENWREDLKKIKNEIL